MNELEKQKIILRALIVYWDCNACKALGWQEECKANGNKNDCCYDIYNHLRDHIHAIDEIKARIGR